VAGTTAVAGTTEAVDSTAADIMVDTIITTIIIIITWGWRLSREWQLDRRLPIDHRGAGSRSLAESPIATTVTTGTALVVPTMSSRRSHKFEWPAGAHHLVLIGRAMVTNSLGGSRAKGRRI